MELLLIGGGIFLGASLVEASPRAGTSPDGVQPRPLAQRLAGRVEALVGDRSSDLAQSPAAGSMPSSTCGYVPADVRASAAAFASCRRYCFVSSISAYASFAHAPVGESDPLARSDVLAEDDRDRAHYGPEGRVRARRRGGVRRASPDRPARPDRRPARPTGRFSHWPWRALAGGEILVSRVPARSDPADRRARPRRLDRPRPRDRRERRLQRDRPAGRSPVDWPALLAACTTAASPARRPAAAVVPVAEAYLIEQGVAPWNELPLWLPSSDPEHLGFARVDCSPAVAAGLVNAAARRDRRGGARRVRRPRCRRSAPPRQAHARARTELIGRWRGRTVGGAGAPAAARRHEDPGRHHRRRPGRPAARRAARQGRHRQRRPRAAQPPTTCSAASAPACSSRSRVDLLDEAGVGERLHARRPAARRHRDLRSAARGTASTSTA